MPTTSSQLWGQSEFSLRSSSRRGCLSGCSCRAMLFSSLLVLPHQELRARFSDQLSYTQLMIWAPIFATAGSQFGHWLGVKYGRPFFDRPDSRFFNQARVQQTERWLLKYGLGKALILSHFIPFVRTLLNPLCGIIGIPAKKFFFWNVIGSYIWTVGIISAGYLLGERLEGSVDVFLLPAIMIIVTLSLIPIILEYFRSIKRK